MKYNLFKFSFFALLLILDSCIEPFSPPEVNSPDTYLVVDGFLNVGQDTSKIELRRTQNTSETANPVIEKGAKITAEGEAGEIYAFTEKSNGLYILLPSQINQSGKYRLRIKTTNAKEYLSEFVAVTKTPPIDSVSTRLDLGLNSMVFNINTHDPSNNTRFYRWKFEETWTYRTQYYSTLEVIGNVANGSVVERKDNINTCYRTNKSSSILLGSTIKLSQDIIKDLPINIVSIPSNKLLFKYSILVKQYALSREAFEYWTDLAKTTQGTGSLFDPLPSQVTGNIKNVNDAQELVFGYFSAVTEQKKRIFIAPGLGALARCETDTLLVACLPRREEQCALETSGLLLYYADPRQQTVIVAEANCVDCRLQGGVTTKPSFWE